MRLGQDVFRGQRGQQVTRDGASRSAVTIRMRSGGTKPARRSTAWIRSGRSPTSGKNCLGRSAVDSGQNRVPWPPARTTAQALTAVRVAPGVDRQRDAGAAAPS